jgi:hypothetical protein
VTAWQLAIAVAGVAGGVWSWLSERRKIRAARTEGYGAGWDACEAHRRAHEAIWPASDPDEAFDAGYEAGKQVAVIKVPATVEWQNGFAFGFRLGQEESDTDEPIDIDVTCGCARCRAEMYSIN